MALQKQPLALNFARGIDLKTDPYQMQLGTFQSLTNSVFTTTGRLTKRNGFNDLTQLPNTEQTTLTTLNDNLIATGTDLYAYSRATDQWLNKGTVQPVNLNVQSMVRSSTGQESPDASVTAEGLVCLAYEDSGNGYYQISDSTTGQQIVARQALPATSTNVRTFILDRYFIVTFMATVAGNPHLQYVAIPISSPTTPGPIADISSAVASITAGYDAYSEADSLFIAWGGSGGVVRVTYLGPSLVVATPVAILASDADLMSVTVDAAMTKVWVSFWDTTSNNAYSAIFSYQLNPLMAKTQILTGVELRTLTSIARNNTATVFYETINAYAFSGGADSDFVSSVTVTPPGSGTGSGSASSPVAILRSVGLASKPFIGANSNIYMLVVYGDTHQTPATDNSNESTYFLIDTSGTIIMRMAATNAGGYATNQVLPTISSIDSMYYVPYLITDFLATVNKGTDLPAGTPVSAIYTQAGINLAMFTINIDSQYSAEIAHALHLTGGQIWEFDGVKPVELGFHVYPENLAAALSASPGNLTDQLYYYAVTYEWTDNQGNLHRSAPSVPLPITVTGGPKAVDLFVPTLRLTAKASPNPVRIVVYRWSVAQPVYYQVTSITSPVINDPSVDYVTIVDTLADSAILGQTILYTTGGVIENIAPPASIASALFNNRLFLVDAEDQNLLWYSKQVIESTPVEMSDLLTIYVAPTTGAQGSTGPMTALGAMDDKLIVFKKDAMYYINGIGPDNTGANNGFSDPVFIAGTVGCTNPKSIVLIPNGLMFQSDKGIWLLGRDLSTRYVGAPVESYNDSIVQSATAIPGTNEVRFILNNNVTLMYDYFFDQWSTHTNISAISATLYQSKHTYLNSYGHVFQEAPGSYKDGSVPVLLSLTTSWVNIAGVQGLERFYFANLLGTYFTPFKLNVSLAYDYNPSDLQNIIVTPDNYAKPWGDEAQWGSGPQWGGGPGNVFSARCFPAKQKCQSFQVTIQELFDPSYGTDPGQGLSLSGLALIVGMKKGYRTQRASRSFG